MLCSICVNFNVRALLLKAVTQPPKGFNDPTSPETLENLRPAIPYFFKHHANLLSLRASAATGCELCSFIWQSHVGRSHPNDLTDDLLSQGTSAQQIFLGTAAWDATLHGLPHVAAVQNGDGHTSHVSKQGLVQMRTLASFEVCATRGREPSDHQHLLARSIYSNSGSAECLQLAATLLGNCMSTHDSCSLQYPHSSELPTRIIDTAGSDPKLVDGGGRRDVYAALSYCWGGHSDFTLTTATEQSFRAGLPLNDFPPTLRHAILIVKALGIRYIWIDALCIIQDSAQDWASEASRMRHVYTGAVVTIAAACASTTGEGIFRDRTQGNYPQCWLDWTNGATPAPKVFLRPGTELWDDKMHLGALNTRGWVLQETLLAPRTLWFSHQQICFECPKGSVDEGGRFLRIADIYRSKEYIQKLRQRMFPQWKRRLLPALKRLHVPLAITFRWPSITNMLQARDMETLRWRALPYTPFTLQGEFKPPAQPTAYSHFDFWGQIIQNYSSRALTNPTDVLPALSGLASEFQRATGDTYVAGLWKMDIIQGLSWNRGELRKKRSDGYLEDPPSLPKQYLAPSWSWASILGQKVLFEGQTQFDHIKPFAKLIDIKLEFATSDRFGALTGGSITLGAPFLILDCESVAKAPGLPGAAILYSPVASMSAFTSDKY
ncbi:hypothetical protein PFICI_00284 [Pestalotiopsis fici W106-1]|uniref:Heterokaryon incompatibility domain-containing protein n=1 Tax=Pestalotiopsis fici (strain W106-1 / CGMCC3.15140) TaxID=1229662 RepID=W3XMF2_PESFW|nr:uncharacterized protein PFICI_00284 [Pestalotiopsis fici W106-1]ETS86456.1 hypothetical protein PFICI_00284 [Pestalotiopsis fici W106-1]